MIRSTAVSAALETILGSHLAARAGEGGKFGSAHPVYQKFGDLEEAIRAFSAIRQRPNLVVKAGPGQGNWARVPWIAIMDARETTSTQRGVYIVFLFRQDMSGVYLTLNQGVVDLRQLHGTPEARKILRSRASQLESLLTTGQEDQRGFQSGTTIDLRTDASLGKAYEHSTAACKLYEKEKIPSDETIEADLEFLLAAYDEYIESDLRRSFTMAEQSLEAETEWLPPPDAEARVHSEALPAHADFSQSQGLNAVLAWIRAKGFVFEPWQVAQYVTAVRTKPFVILAGITGTGKSKLPRLVEEASGGRAELVPVRPDWTDSSEVLGYVDLEGNFRPGRVLEIAHAADNEDDLHHTLIIDEMNLARVEHYFAEVLSRIEDRHPLGAGGWASSPLIQSALHEADAEWGKVRIPPNLALVGTVNMDESAHGFSRKVLDRAFTLELSDVALYDWSSVRSGSEGGGVLPSETRLDPEVLPWPVSAWWPRATRLSELVDPSPADRALIEDAIRELSGLNIILAPAQLQVGYRTRDEVALFLLHAEEIRAFFRTTTGEPVNPMDLAFLMKVLPRIAGGSTTIRRVLLGIMGWATSGTPFDHEDDARPVMDEWDELNRPGRLPEARHPAVAARTCLMWDRLVTEGFTSFWM